jgi:hypothetical protein
MVEPRSEEYAKHSWRALRDRVYPIFFICLVVGVLIAWLAFLGWGFVRLFVSG